MNERNASLDLNDLRRRLADAGEGSIWRSLEELAERARTLNGVLTVDQDEEAGTTIRVVLPPYVTAR